MQLNFDFPSKECYQEQDFLIFQGNSKVFNFITKYKTDISNIPKIFTIYGPKSSGKTHLAHIWKRKVNANSLDINNLQGVTLNQIIKPKQTYIIEDIDKDIDQTILFHIFNLIQEKEAFLLFTTSTRPQHIKYSFLDIESRIKNTFCLDIDEPNSELTKMLLIKHFSSKQLLVDNRVISYISKNIKYSFQRINEIVRLLEFYCFEQKRKITIPLASRVLKMT